MAKNPSYQDTSWMFERNSVARPAAPQPALDPRALEIVHRSPEVGQIKTLVTAAWVIGAAAGLIGLILAGVVIFLTHGKPSYVWALLPLALLCGVVVAAVLSIQWTHQAALRAWRLEDEDRLYLYRAQEPPAQPLVEPQTVRVELTQPLDGQARQTQIADLDATTGQLRTLADGLLRGAPFAESTWTGQGRPFSRGQFSELRAEFIRRGWAAWRHPDAPAQGAILTSQGKAVLRSFASETAGPLPYQSAEGIKNA